MNDKILIVDDSVTDCKIISGILSDYNTIIAKNGKEALNIIDKNQEIDLMILDLIMPEIDGFEVLKTLNETPGNKKIRTIILTNYDELENEIKGLKLGAVDFIRKPINKKSFKLRIKTQLELRKAKKQIENDNIRLDTIVNRRTKELMITRDITIQALVGLLEVRDIESHNHIIRTQKIMKLLCENLKNTNRFNNTLTDKYIKELVDTTPLHDIGKVGIPDNILLKPSKLNTEEFQLMKKHVDFGVRALKDELHNDDVMPSFIKTAIEIIGTHHERYDGEGYPYGLKGKDIPLPGRLMAIIDVYDALMNKRVYKPAYDLDYTINHIKEERGEHFDPFIVDSFLEIQDKVYHISKTY